MSSLHGMWMPRNIFSVWRGIVLLPVVTATQYLNDPARAELKGQENVRLLCMNGGLLAPESI